MACTAACVRAVMFSFAKIRLMWFFTVFSERCSFALISLFDMPRAMRRMISVSRTDSSFCAVRPKPLERRLSTPRDARIDVGVTARHALDGANQLGGQDVLDDVAVGARAEAALHDLGLDVRRENADLRLRRQLADRAHRFRELDVVTVEVEHDQVGAEAAQLRVCDGVGVTDDLDLDVGRENLAQRLAEERLALDDENANGLRGRLGGGDRRSEHVLCPQSFGVGH